MKTPTLPNFSFSSLAEIVDQIVQGNERGKHENWEETQFSPIKASVGAFLKTKRTNALLKRDISGPLQESEIKIAKRGFVPINSFNGKQSLESLASFATTTAHLTKVNRKSKTKVEAVASNLLYDWIHSEKLAVAMQMRLDSQQVKAICFEQICHFLLQTGQQQSLKRVMKEMELQDGDAFVDQIKSVLQSENGRDPLRFRLELVASYAIFGAEKTREFYEWSQRQLNFVFNVILNEVVLENEESVPLLRILRETLVDWGKGGMEDFSLVYRYFVSLLEVISAEKNPFNSIKLMLFSTVYDILKASDVDIDGVRGYLKIDESAEFLV